MHFLVYAAGGCVGIAALWILWQILGELKAVNRNLRKAAGETEAATPIRRSSSSSSSSSSSRHGSRSTHGSHGHSGGSGGGGSRSS